MGKLVIPEGTGARSSRRGKVVFGSSHVIGNRSSANHFSEEMFDGSMDPLLMVNHFVMTGPTFDSHLHAGISAVTAMFEDLAGSFLNRDSNGNKVAQRGGDLYWRVAASGAAAQNQTRRLARHSRLSDLGRGKPARAGLAWQ